MNNFFLSLLFHILLFIIFAYFSLFSYKTIEISPINVSLIDNSVLENNSKYQVSKKVLDYNNLVVNSNKNVEHINKDIKSNLNKTQNKDNIISTVIEKKQDRELSSEKKSLTKSIKSKDLTKSEENKDNKENFLKNILQGLDKGSLSETELKALNDQIKGCWYGQGGHNVNYNLKVSLILIMNTDATIKNIKVENEASYNTPLRKSILLQVLRALNNPECKQLNLPVNSFNNWQTIHITFDPKE